MNRMQANLDSYKQGSKSGFGEKCTNPNKKCSFWIYIHNVRLMGQCQYIFYFSHQTVSPGPIRGTRYISYEDFVFSAFSLSNLKKSKNRRVYLKPRVNYKTYEAWGCLSNNPSKTA